MMYIEKNVGKIKECINPKGEKLQLPLNAPKKIERGKKGI